MRITTNTTTSTTRCEGSGGEKQNGDLYTRTRRVRMYAYACKKKNRMRASRSAHTVQYVCPAKTVFRLATPLDALVRCPLKQLITLTKETSRDSAMPNLTSKGVPRTRKLYSTIRLIFRERRKSCPFRSNSTTHLWDANVL